MTQTPDPLLRLRLATTPLGSVAAVLCAIGILTWGALPYLPGQIDDAFIVFAYAHNFAAVGELVWNTGARVEGYSSPLHLAMMVAAVAAGLDLSVFARVLSYVCSVLVLLVLARPLADPHRYILVLLVAAWQPFQYWSTAGLETALATLIAVCGWPLVLGERRAWANGCLVLCLFAVTRPEGAAWLAAALLRRLWMERELGPPERRVAFGLTMLGAYHVARFAYYGDVTPTPYLVKVVAVTPSGAGLAQVARELLSASGIVAAAALWRGPASPWAWVPLLIQSALLTRADGDWMGHARFLLPALVAGAQAQWQTRRAECPRWPAMLLVTLMASIAFAWEPSRGSVSQPDGSLGHGWRDPTLLARPVQALSTPWNVPILEEASFLIERVPRGAGAAISDVGIPGNIRDMRVWDNAGLTDRVTAEVIAGRRRGLPSEIQSRYSSDTDIWCVRYGVSSDGSDSAPEWMSARVPVAYPSQSSNPRLRWRCRNSGMVDPETRVQRWRALLERYPSQDWIRWHLARALIADGQDAAARELQALATWVRHDGPGWVVFGDVQGTDYHPRRGWALYRNGTRRSMEASSEFWRTVRGVRLDVDAPGATGALVATRWHPACGPEVAPCEGGQPAQAQCSFCARWRRRLPR
jgi:hypothetical protein